MTIIVWFAFNIPEIIKVIYIVTFSCRCSKNSHKKDHNVIQYNVNSISMKGRHSVCIKKNSKVPKGQTEIVKSEDRKDRGQKKKLQTNIEEDILCRSTRPL